MRAQFRAWCQGRGHDVEALNAGFRQGKIWCIKSSTNETESDSARCRIHLYKLCLPSTTSTFSIRINHSLNLPTKPNHQQTLEPINMSDYKPTGTLLHSSLPIFTHSNLPQSTTVSVRMARWTSALSRPSSPTARSTPSRPARRVARAVAAADPAPMAARTHRVRPALVVMGFARTASRISD